jgi:TetR/AcrR family transcriptional regulator, transcriptional repressor for nem operon
MARTLEFNREAVVAAAADSFREKGYGATSLDDLTGHLGIGRASLYNTFGDKRGLFIEALSAYINEAALAEFLERNADCQGQAGYGCLAINVGFELNGADSQIGQAVVSSLERIEDTVMTLIRRGQSDGSVRESVNADEAARAITALIVGMHGMKRIGVAPSVVLGAARAQLAML